MFAAQFALSHTCWPITYLQADKAGLMATFVILRALVGLAALISKWIWGEPDLDQLPHSHDDLPADRPHLAEHEADDTAENVSVIDDLHPRWPKA